MTVPVSLSFTAACGLCGHPLALVNQSHHSTEVVGVLKCLECSRNWTVQVRLFAERSAASEKRAAQRAVKAPA